MSCSALYLCDIVFIFTKLVSLFIKVPTQQNAFQFILNKENKKILKIKL